MKLNPILKKELKKRTSNDHMMLCVFVYNLLFGFLAILLLYVGIHSSEGSLVFNYKTCNEFFVTIGGGQLAAIIFIMPYMGAVCVAREAEKHTLDILLNTKMRPIQIVCGKIASVCSVSFLCTASAFPIYIILYALGALKFKTVIELFVLFLVCTIFISSIGLFFSCLYKRISTAAIWSYIVTIGVIIGTVVLFNLSGAVHSFMKTATFSFNNIEYNGAYSFFLLNPLATFIHLIPNGGQYIVPVQCTSEQLEGYWVELSILCQYSAAVALIFASAYLITPLREKSISFKQKKKDIK